MNGYACHESTLMKKKIHNLIHNFDEYEMLIEISFRQFVLDKLSMTLQWYHTF